MDWEKISDKGLEYIEYLEHIKSSYSSKESDKTQVKIKRNIQIDTSQKRRSKQPIVYKQVLNLISHKKIPIKITMNYHFARPAKWINEEDQQHLVLGGHGARGPHLHCLWDWTMVQLLWKSAW